MVAQGDLLIFVDADDQVQPGFLGAMQEALKRSGVVGSRFEHRELNPGTTGDFGQVQTEGLLEGYGFLPHASGGSMGFKRAVFESLGGFDDKPFCEDADISWKAQLAGHEIVFVADSVVSVRQRSELSSMFRQHRNFGMGQALLYRDYREHGMKRRRLGVVLADWVHILKGLPALRTYEEKARWVRRAGRNLGFLLGSVKYGVYYP